MANTLEIYMPYVCMSAWDEWKARRDSGTLVVNGMKRDLWKSIEEKKKLSRNDFDRGSN